MIGTILLGTTLVIGATGIRVVRPTQLGVVERFGKFNRVADQGFNWIIPVIDSMRRINTTEQMVVIDSTEMITKDNLNAKVDLNVYFKIQRSEESVKKCLYNVDDVENQMVALAQTTARAIIGTMDFSQVNSERQKLNDKLKSQLDIQAKTWGVQIIRVEIKEIMPPSDVQETMNKILKANNEKVANKDLAEALETKADGEKKAKIKEAEGLKQASILKAEGEAMAIQKVAEARAKEIELVNKSAQIHFKGNAQTLKQLETAERSLANNTKLILDGKTNIQTIVSDVAGITPIKK